MVGEESVGGLLARFPLNPEYEVASGKKNQIRSVILEL
jgi:hypothetical protein